MGISNRLVLIATGLFLAVCTVPAARAADLPADLCSLLPAAEVSKALGQAFGAPEKSEAPRPFANTNTGTDCNYLTKDHTKLWFRIYVDPSASAATELFARLKMFYGTPTPVAGLGDEAYFDAQHAIHVRKGKVRYYLNLSSNPAAKENQIKDLAARVAGQI